MAKAYRIREWDSEFETAETRKLKYLRWWPKPNQHDELYYKRMLKEADKEALFCAWVLICDIASSSAKGQRGWLIRNGRALTPEDLAILTDFPVEIFERALEYFSSSKQRWLVQDTFDGVDDARQSADEQLTELSDSSTLPWVLEAVPDSPSLPLEASPTRFSREEAEAEAHPEVADTKSAGTPGGSPAIAGESPADGKGKKEEKEGEESAARPPFSPLQIEELPKGYFPRQCENEIRHAEERIKAFRRDPGLRHYRLRPRSEAPDQVLRSSSRPAPSHDVAYGGPPCSRPGLVNSLIGPPGRRPSLGRIRDATECVSSSMEKMRDHGPGSSFGHQIFARLDKITVGCG